jgi:hypothetical protein
MNLATRSIASRLEPIRMYAYGLVVPSYMFFNYAIVVTI